MPIISIKTIFGISKNSFQYSKTIYIKTLWSWMVSAFVAKYGYTYQVNLLYIYSRLNQMGNTILCQIQTCNLSRFQSMVCVNVVGSVSANVRLYVLFWMRKFFYIFRKGYNFVWMDDIICKVLNNAKCLKVFGSFHENMSRCQIFLVLTDTCLRKNNLDTFVR